MQKHFNPSNFNSHRNYNLSSIANKLNPTQKDELNNLLKAGDITDINQFEQNKRDLIESYELNLIAHPKLPEVKLPELDQFDEIFLRQE